MKPWLLGVAFIPRLNNQTRSLEEVNSLSGGGFLGMWVLGEEQGRGWQNAGPPHSETYYRLKLKARQGDSFSASSTQSPENEAGLSIFPIQLPKAHSQFFISPRTSIWLLKLIHLAKHKSKESITCLCSVCM